MTRLTITAAQWRRLRDALYDEDQRERMAFLLCGQKHSASEDILLCHRVVQLKEDSYQRSTSDSIAVDPIAVNDILNLAENQGFSIVMAHSHPFGDIPARFSPADTAG